jgi:beta-lactam-binding protein with PASTA domain
MTPRDKPSRNRRRDAGVGAGIAIVLAVVAVVSGREQDRGTSVPDLTGLAVYQTPTMLEARGLELGNVSLRACPRLELPATVLGQEPEASTLVAPGSSINVTTCAPISS